MQIGIEVELSSSRLDQYDVCRASGLNYQEFINHPLLTQSVKVKMSEEYYSSTCEYNFTPFELAKTELDSVKAFLDEQINEYGLSLSSERPSFVGTHIHIFDEGKLRMNKPKLLRGLLSYILDNLDGLCEDSLYRLVEGHQLWTYWSNKNGHKWLKVLQEYGKDPDYYNGNSNKMKYSPIIISPRTRRGKPKSLEIRLIPNEFLFDHRLEELLEEIDSKKIYRRKPVEIDDFVHTIYKKLGQKNESIFFEEETQIDSEETQIDYGRGIIIEDIMPSAFENVMAGFHREKIGDYVTYPEQSTMREIEYNGILVRNIKLNQLGEDLRSIPFQLLIERRELLTNLIEGCQSVRNIIFVIREEIQNEIIKRGE